LRLFGALIDVVVCSAFSVPVSLFLVTRPSGSLAIFVLWVSSNIFGFLLVNGRLLKTRVQTVGKMFVGTKIIDADEEELPFWRVFIARYAFPHALLLMPFIGPLIVSVDPLFVFARDRRWLHDHFAGTLVVRVEPPESPE